MHERASAFVLFAVVPAAVRGPHGLEFLDDAVDAIGHEAGEVQVAEGIEIIELLFAKARVRHVIPSRLFLYDRFFWRRAQLRTAYQYRVLRSLSSCPARAVVRSRRSATKSTRNDCSTRSRPPNP